MPGKARSKTSQETNGKKAGKTSAKVSKADINRAVTNILIMPQIAKDKPTPEAKKGRSPKKSPAKSNAPLPMEDINSDSDIELTSVEIVDASMVTIHQDLITSIKVEAPDEDDDIDQISNVLKEKLNPTEVNNIELVVVSENELNNAVTNGSPDKKFVCEVCQMSFSRQWSLKVHFKNAHSNERLFKCKSCDERFATPMALKSHESKAKVCKPCGGLKFCGPVNFEKHLNEHSNVSFNCQLCSSTFGHKKDLRSHEQTHKTDEVIKVFSCIVCKKLFASQMSATACARVHTHHYECAICKMSCRTPAELKRHEQTHDSNKRFQCAMCSAHLKSEASLKLHVRELHERPTERTIPCTVDDCDKMFFTTKQRTQHEHAAHSAKKFSCYMCSKMFLSQARLVAHMNDKHGKEETNKKKTKSSKGTKDMTNGNGNKSTAETSPGQASCQICGKVLASKYYLKVHMSQHSSVKQFSCDECGKGFSRKWVMETHKKTVHMGLESRQFPCTECPSAFVNASQLNYHIKSVHTAATSGAVMQDQTVSYPCTFDDCDHVSKTKAQLEAHLKSLKHCEVKDFHCPHCPMTFNRKWVMEEHILRKHEDTRRSMNFKCLLCGRGFYFHKSYLRHANVKHTQDCEFCDLSFATTRYHMDHRRIVHGIVEKLLPDIKWSPCNICGKLLGGSKKLQKHILREHSDVPTAEFAGTFEENNDDPEIVLNYRKRKANKGRAIKPKRAKKDPQPTASVKEEIKGEVTDPLA